MLTERQLSGPFISLVCFVFFNFLPWQSVSQMLLAYLSRLSAIADNKINCGPALTWMEVRQHTHLAGQE